MISVKVRETRIDLNGFERAIADGCSIPPEVAKALIDLIKGMDIIMESAIGYLHNAEDCEGVDFGSKEIRNRYTNLTGGI